MHHFNFAFKRQKNKNHETDEFQGSDTDIGQASFNDR